MGNSLIGLRTPQGNLCPGIFRSNEKQAYRWLCGHGWDAEAFSNLLEYLQIPGDRLGKTAHSEDYSSYDEYAVFCGPATDKAWRDYRKKQDEAWQDPSGLLDYLDQLIAKMKSSPPSPDMLELDDEEEISHFLLFFIDIREMAKWAVDNGIPLVRIEWSG